MKFCFIDCETSGTDPKQHGLIQIAGVIVIDGKIIERFDIKAAPFTSDVIDPGALEVNGLTELILKSYPAPTTAFAELLTILSKYVDRYHSKDKFHFIGWNADFDADFIRAFFIKNGDEYFGSWFWYPILDVCKLAGLHLAARRHQMTAFKLVKVAYFLGLDVDESKAHDASYDIDLTIRMFQYLVHKLGIDELKIV